MICLSLYVSRLHSYSVIYIKNYELVQLLCKYKNMIDLYDLVTALSPYLILGDKRLCGPFRVIVFCVCREYIGLLQV